jgi:stress-induced-phosphoprotein 1
MTRLIPLGLILILLASCAGKVKKESYDPKAVVFNNKAVEHMQKFENDSALVLFDKAIEADGNYYVPHFNKAGIYLRMKDFDKAMQECEMVIKEKPDMAEGWTIAGMLHEKHGDTETAMKYYKKSIDIFDVRISDSGLKNRINSNRMNRAISMLLLGKEKEARDEMKKLIGKNQDDMMIIDFIKLNKQDYINKVLGN